MAGESTAAASGVPNPSLQQTAVFGHVAEWVRRLGKGGKAESLVEEAVARSGKTTPIVGAANLVPRNMKSVFLAFNRPPRGRRGVQCRSGVSGVVVRRRISRGGRIKFDGLPVAGKWNALDNTMNEHHVHETHRFATVLVG